MQAEEYNNKLKYANRNKLERMLRLAVEVKFKKFYDHLPGLAWWNSFEILSQYLWIDHTFQ